jgi:hypothetical protein
MASAVRSTRYILMRVFPPSILHNLLKSTSQFAMEILHSGTIVLYEPGGKNPYPLFALFYRDKELRLSLDSRHADRFSKALFTVGDWGEVTYRLQFRRWNPEVHSH